MNEISKVGGKCGFSTVEGRVDEDEGAAAVCGADIGKTKVVVEVSEGEKGRRIIGIVMCFREDMGALGFDEVETALMVVWRQSALFSSSKK